MKRRNVLHGKGLGGSVSRGLCRHNRFHSIAKKLTEFECFLWA